MVDLSSGGGGGGYTIRAPTTSPSSPNSSPTQQKPFIPPSIDFLAGPWHVTHSSLPMWKSNRNVVITYTPVNGSGSGDIDDLVTYQPLNSRKEKSVHGVDRPEKNGVQSAYHWRGKGWLKIASSRWEVLGWGEEDGGWVVTFFRKTLFTPAGVDVYSRRREGMREEVLDGVKKALSESADGDGRFKSLIDGLFEVRRD